MGVVVNKFSLVTFYNKRANYFFIISVLLLFFSYL